MIVKKVVTLCKKQIATLLALSTAAACILTYQPTAVGAEEFSVLDNTDKLVQEALEDNTDELGDALYDSVTEGEIPLYEADASSTQSELEKRCDREGNVQRYFLHLQITYVPYHMKILQKEYMSR